MPDLTHIIDSWGYVAIFVIVVLGNIGLPVPEETVLTIGGYLAWQGQLRFSLVVLVGIMMASAAAGGGTKIRAQSAPAAATASSTVFHTGNPS